MGNLIVTDSEDQGPGEKLLMVNQPVIHQIVCGNRESLVC